MNEFKAVTVKREDLENMLKAFPEGEYVHFAVELDSIEGDQILWVDHGKFNADRDFLIINSPYGTEK